jgi:hypothetical protein
MRKYKRNIASCRKYKILQNLSKILYVEKISKFFLNRRFRKISRRFVGNSLRLLGIFKKFSCASPSEKFSKFPRPRVISYTNPFIFAFKSSEAYFNQKAHSLPNFHQFLSNFIPQKFFIYF